jgi:hypothetical protein
MKKLSLQSAQTENLHRQLVLDIVTYRQRVRCKLLEQLTCDDALIMSKLYCDESSSDEDDQPTAKNKLKFELLNGQS